MSRAHRIYERLGFGACPTGTGRPSRASTCIAFRARPAAAEREEPFPVDDDPGDLAAGDQPLVAAVC